MINSNKLPEILFITSYPPRECGIATYSQDIMKALNNKFGDSFSMRVCALEAENENFHYPDEVKYILNTSRMQSYVELAERINKDESIKIVAVQHEFGFFEGHENDLLQFLYLLNKQICLTFHTVLPHPDEKLKRKVKYIAAICQYLIVMTNNAAEILKKDYELSANKIEVIPHGTHLVPHLDKVVLKRLKGLSGRMVLSTFGLLSAGKRIETTLLALPEIIKSNPEVIFLIIGKTHPSVVKAEGEVYRYKLDKMIFDLELQNHVQFVNYYLPLPELLEYLQLTDIYLFTSNDPNQAVSGTFSYAMSCGCPIISTPIPHAMEVLQEGAGFIIDFENPVQMSETVIRLLADEPLRKSISISALQRIASTAWENSAIAHARLFEKMSTKNIRLRYALPEINLNHLKSLTTNFGMIQFSKINAPDISSGYTIDDNARALIAICHHFEITGDISDLTYINLYFNFIQHCMLPENYFNNYIGHLEEHTPQNSTVNLADANGRAIWALGYLISLAPIMPAHLILEAEMLMDKALKRVNKIHSTRAMAFTIKGLYYFQLNKKSENVNSMITLLGNRLVQMYRHESAKGWEWFEGYLTYANSILPEALLYAYLVTGINIYKEIAKTSFDFLISQTFNEDGIKVISNKSWLHKGKVAENYGEQPIDVAYTILTLSRFHAEFREEGYLSKMQSAFNWFLGDNHLKQIIYNPCTGGCYDGLEEKHINLNQGAESTLSYLMARLTIGNHFESEVKVEKPLEWRLKLNMRNILETAN